MSDEEDGGGGLTPVPMDRYADKPGGGSLYAQQLMAEKRRLDDKFSGGGADLLLTKKLLLSELERIQNGGKPTCAGGSRPAGEDRRFADIIKEKPIKVAIRVLVPVKEHPKFNFVGKLLGPKGNSLKRLQEDTMTKMAILGRGSMRDKHKEEELRASSDPKYSHFNDDLHVEITAFAPPAEAHARIAYALAEVRKFLVPDYNDEIRQEQMREMQMLNSPLLPAAEVLASSESHHSSAGTPPGSGAKQQNGRGGRTLTAAAAAAPGAFIYNQQQLLLHPAFRGLAAARPHNIPLAGAAVFQGHPAGSILSRLRTHPHLAAGPAIVAPPRLTAAGDGMAKHHPHLHPHHHRGGGILSMLGAAHPRADGGEAAAGAGAGEPVLMCAGSEDVAQAQAGDLAAMSAAAAAAASNPAAVYGLYENYAAAAAAAAASLSAANGTGYGLLDSYTNGNGLLTAEEVESTADSVNGSMSAEVSSRSEAGVVKADRTRYRHDPYARYAAAAAAAAGGVKMSM